MKRMKFHSTDSLTWAEIFALMHNAFDNLTEMKILKNFKNGKITVKDVSDFWHANCREEIDERYPSEVTEEEKDMAYIVVADVAKCMLEITCNRDLITEEPASCFICGDHTSTGVCSQECLEVAKSIKNADSGNYIKGM